MSMSWSVAAASQGSAFSDEMRLAYVDPGVGSFIIQAVIAAIAGIAVASRMYWTKIKSFFGASSDSEEDDSSDD